MTTNLARPKQEVTVSAQFSGELTSLHAWPDAMSVWLLVISGGKTIATGRQALGTVSPGAAVRVTIAAEGPRRTANRLDTYIETRLIVCRSGLPVDPDTGEPGQDSIYLTRVYRAEPITAVALSGSMVALTGTLTTAERSQA